LLSWNPQSLSLSDYATLILRVEALKMEMQAVTTKIERG
jgi:hypothetical protein